MARIDIDTNQVKPLDNDYSPIPAGTYLLALETSKVKETSKVGERGNRGSYLSVTVVVQDGLFKGRKVFDQFTLSNDNPEAVEIGQGQLSALIRACGKVAVGDSEELHGLPFIGKVKIEPGRDGYEPRNRLAGGFKSASGDTPAPVAVGSGAPKAAPWGKKA